MIGAQPKRKNPETGKVDADYYFGDIKTQRKYLIDFAQAVNSQKELGEPQLNMQRMVHLNAKRIGRFYNYNNKYDGKGNLRENLQD